MIAAILGRPRLLLADEPATALDVTTQQDVMAIPDGLRRAGDLAMIFVTHDLDLAAAVTHRIAVMHAGAIAGTAPSVALRGRLIHPYRAALWRSRPSIGSRARLAVLPGRPVAAFEAGDGCASLPAAVRPGPLPGRTACSALVRRARGGL
jgi:ABC-type dipeptide/oligopeptide/nickel transport system ATPase component